jgi:CO/xanthine dehydrogenase Mo-binding subunit
MNAVAPAIGNVIAAHTGARKRSFPVAMDEALGVASRSA